MRMNDIKIKQFKHTLEIVVLNFNVVDYFKINKYEFQTSSL